MIAFLNKIQLFADLTDDELGDIANIFTKVEIPKGELIIEEHTTTHEMYIIAQGAVEVFLRRNDLVRPLLYLGEGQIFGEMALIDQGYRSASVRAVNNCTLYSLTDESFAALCQSNYRIGYMVMRNLSIDLAFKLRHRNLADL